MANKIKLQSRDAVLFEVEEDTAFLSQTVKNLVEDAGSADAIPLPNVSGSILAKVLEYCVYHAEAGKEKEGDKPTRSEDQVRQWDSDFVKVDQATLFDLILVGPVRLPVREPRPPTPRCVPIWALCQERLPCRRLPTTSTSLACWT